LVYDFRSTPYRRNCTYELSVFLREYWASQDHAASHGRNFDSTRMCNPAAQAGTHALNQRRIVHNVIVE
jgi:hypothetical protein